MGDTTNGASFFRPWNTSPRTKLNFKSEDSYEESESELDLPNEENSHKISCDYQPLDLLNDLVNQTTSDISRSQLSNSSSPLMNTDSVNNKEDNIQPSAFSPFRSILNTDAVFLPNLQSYIPSLSYNAELLNTQHGFMSMNCFNQYVSSLQSEVNLLHQQDLVAKQTKKMRPKKYVCDFCGTAFSNNGQLKGHTRIHTGERPYKCDNVNCNKTFTRNEELTRHKKIHTGDKPHKCLSCNKCFGRKDHLKKHTKTHEKGNFNYPTPYQLACTIPYISSHSLPSSQTSPISVPYIYPFI